MQKSLLSIMFTLGLILICGGCGGAGTSTSSTQTQPSNTSTVNLVVHDTPPNDTTVLSFQIQITGAVLQPGNVSLLPKPITVDLAQLVSDTSFLSSTVIGSATYTSLELTFASPQISIQNDSGAPIVTPSQTCANGQVCTFLLPVNPTTVTISSGVFPLTVTSSTPTGLNVDLSIPDLLQSDLSLSFANGKSVNLSLLPAANSTVAQAQVNDVLGVVQSIATNQMTIITALGNTLVFTTDTSTQYSFPSSICPASAFSCLVANQIVTANLSMLGEGALRADSISFSDNAGTKLAQGIVVSIGAGTPPAQYQMLVHGAVPSGSGINVGDLFTVTILPGAVYSIGAFGYPSVTSASFGSGADLVVGQEVQAEVTANLTTSGTLSYSSGRILLESSQLIGQVVSINSASGTFVADGLSRLFQRAAPTIPQLQAQTGATTTFVNLTPSGVTALTVGENVGIRGPLFNTTATSGSPTIAATQVAAQSSN